MAYTLRLYGKVVPDETRIYRINASTDSWIREISDHTTGSIIKKNQLLAEALAPAYFNAQVTYLIALDNVDRIKRQLGGQLRHQQGDLADNQMRVAVQALQNLGITDAQIEELAKTREAQPYLQVRAPSQGVVLSRNVTLYQWFKAGEEFYSIADIGRVWVYADVYENEARYLKPGTTVKITHAQMGKTFNARVSEVLPLFDPIAKTLKVRLDIDNPDYDLRPDMFVDVEIETTMPDSMHVTADAVIDSGTQAIVYVDSGDGIFEPRKVETGWRLGRQIQITGGLMPGEQVVVSGNFLIDSESRMKTAASGSEDKRIKDPVCGMYPDKEEAESAGRTATHAGKTYYFCSDFCVQAFTEDPEKFIVEKKPQNQAAMPELENGWIEVLKPLRTNQGKSKQGKKKKDTLSTSPKNSGIVDWDGPETEKNGSADKDWQPGWGKFPGAKYLGQTEE
jgi:RND family efflux transporter MFP subunit